MTFSTGGTNFTWQFVAVAIYTLEHCDILAFLCEKLSQSICGFPSCGLLFYSPASAAEVQVCVGRRRYGTAGHSGSQRRGGGESMQIY